MCRLFLFYANIHCLAKFEYSGKCQVLAILDSPWVKVLKNRLYVYRDEKGVPFEIRNAEVERFKTIIKRFDFQIVSGEPSGEVQEGDEVTIINGPMSGSDGRVKEIRERDGQILVTVELSMFMNKMRIAVPGISIADVRLKGEKAQQLLKDPVIAQFEDELIELLSHLHGKKGSRQLNKDDQKQLRFLYQYSDIVFEDNEENRKKFAALMLICAYLMDNKDETERRLRDLRELRASLRSELKVDSSEPIANGQQPTAELDCYLVTAQFIVTHDPQLRQQIKAWRKNHPDCPLIIRRFLSIAKQIRC